jgi:UDP-N-acetylglucosamine--N-acetylmuramyl-(pentapeptide) pyrophosphoryl-undecaprenol N-acetylglucosamine transferase
MALIPLRGSASRGDQVENARFFEKAGAAVIIPGGGEAAASLVRTIASLAEDAEKRNAMAAASAAIGKTDGAALIAQTMGSAVRDKA